jgi:hypothetical protein
VNAAQILYEGLEQHGSAAAYSTPIMVLSLDRSQIVYHRPNLIRQGESLMPKGCCELAFAR